MAAEHGVGRFGRERSHNAVNAAVLGSLAATIRVTLRAATRMLGALMNREVLDRWCERGILGLVLAILVFGPLAFGAVPTPAFLVVEALTLGVMLLWGARFWLQGRPQLLWPPICWAVVAFAVYAIGRYLTADIEYLARQELIRILVYSFLFLAILNNLHRQEATQTITLVLIFLAMAIAFYALYQSITGSNRVWYVLNSAYPHRGTGTYICPNHLGGFLEMLLPLGLAYTLTSRARPVLRVFLGYASIAILAGIVVTLSRGSWISTALSLLLFFGVLVFHRTYRLASLLFLVVIVGAGVFMFSRSLIFQTRLKQLGVPARVEEDTRIVLWHSALHVWQENIYWGVGPAHYDYRFRKYRPESIQLHPAWAHNDFLNALAEWGLVGAGLLAAAWGLLGLGIIKTWPSARGSPKDIGGKKSSNKLAFVLGASVGLLAILIHSGCDFNMHIPANAILAVTLMALLSSHLRFASEQYWVKVGPWTRLVATIVLVGGLVYLGGQGWHQAKEYWYLRQASAAPNFSPAKVEWLKKALAAEPTNPETCYEIAEAYRIQSAQGGQNYRDLASQAMEWLDRSIKLNRWGSQYFSRYGWCLDWLDRTAESEAYFDRALELDPKGYFTLANMGLHYVQLENYAAARPWFERSLRLQWEDNPIARNYLEIVNTRLMEGATNGNTAEPKGAGR
jgi:O-antigen ligase